MQQCLSCGGQYTPMMPDGTAYFHVCSTLSVPELAAAVTAGSLVLPIDAATGLPETAAVALSRRVYTRANARNENVTPDGKMLSGGKGAVTLTIVPPPTTVPVLMPPIIVGGPATPV